MKLSTPGTRLRKRNPAVEGGLQSRRRGPGAAQLQNAPGEGEAGLGSQRLGMRALESAFRGDRPGGLETVQVESAQVILPPMRDPPGNRGRLKMKELRQRL